jgi:hypothetical protein
MEKMVTGDVHGGGEMHALPRQLGCLHKLCRY